MLLGDEVEPPLDVPPGNGVERTVVPAVEIDPHVLAVALNRPCLAIGVGGHVVLERFSEGRHSPRFCAFGGGVVPSGDAAEQFLGHAPRFVGGDASVASEGDALVGRLAPAVSGAVVDDEGPGARGLDADAEAGELVVPCDPGFLGGLEGLDGSLGQGQLDPGDAFCGVIFHVDIITKPAK